MKKQSIFIFAILMIALGIGLWRENSNGSGVTHWGQKAALTVGTALPLPQAVPTFTLVDTDGTEFTDTTLKQHWSLLMFGYTQCPESCPIILKAITQVQHQLTPQAQVDTVFITIHPEQDTAEHLKHFFQKEEFKGCHLHALTGSKTTIQSLANEVGLHLEAATNDATHIGHSGTLLLINPEGKIAALFTSTAEPAAIAHDVKNMMHRYSQG